MDASRIKKISEQIQMPCLIERTADLLYLTGLDLSKGRLFVSPRQSILFVDGRYYEMAKREAPCQVLPWDALKDIGEKRIGFDSAYVTYEGYLTLKKTHPHTEWVPMPNPVKQLRAIKDRAEIATLKKAADLTWRGYQNIIENLKEGISEEELALEFEIFCRKNGASKLSFSPIIAFGENSAYPHHRAGKSRLRQDQVILIDIGAVVDQYCADMTRIHYFGTPDPRIVQLEKIVQRAQQQAIDRIRPGVRLGELDEVVRVVFEDPINTPKNGAFFGDPSLVNVKQLYTHSLGHGVGLEPHEFPLIRFDGEDKDVIIQPGMVFTIEPGLYQPGVGGVRLEDMIVVTETGCENFFAQSRGKPLF